MRYCDTYTGLVYMHTDDSTLILLFTLWSGQITTGAPLWLLSSGGLSGTAYTCFIYELLAHIRVWLLYGSVSTPYFTTIWIISTYIVDGI